MRTVTAFVCATTDGEFPAVPQRKAEFCIRQIPICQQYRPDKEWKVFGIEQQIPLLHRERQMFTYEAPVITNALPDVSERLLEQLYLRHADALAQLGFNTSVMRRPDEISA